MANEAVLMFETHPAIPFTVADGAGIEKGTLLKMSDSMTVAATSADNDIFAGVMAGLNWLFILVEFSKLQIQVLE